MIARAPVRTFERILVPTDFSRHADRAVAAAVNLVEPGGRLTLLHCTGIGGDEELPAHLAHSIETAIKAHAAEHAGADLAIDTELRSGSPAAEIRALADDFDLICMGGHGRRGARRLILGSVAEVTVRHAPCPVYVAHDFSHDPSGGES
jgi:nucleotide-binding universal stress UspA family protein